jgi:VanZ family protein
LKQRFIPSDLPPILWALLIFVLSSIPSRNLPPLDVFGMDKIAHCAVYFVLCWLIHRSLVQRKRLTMFSSLAISAVLAILYGMTDETHQLFVEGRNASLPDLMADATGALMYVLIHRWFPKRG